MALPLPPVPYGATAVRPDWSDLPAQLRAAITERLGAPVLRARTAHGGFTSGFAAVLETGDDRVFVKAASSRVGSPLADWYAREAAVTAALPDGIGAPRLRWTLTAADHLVVCFDGVDGHTPTLPWRPDGLRAVLAGYARVAAALTAPPAGLTALGLPALSRLARDDLAWWREVAEGREPAPLPVDRLGGRLADLVALEDGLPGYTVSDAVIHGDLRLDNVLVDRDGHAWFCDWTWVCHGPAWFDTASLLVTAYASGLDADSLFTTHPTAREAPPEALDAALAALSGHWLTAAAGPTATGPGGASEDLRRHQRWSGLTALSWLAARRGWSDPVGPDARPGRFGLLPTDLVT